MRKEKQSLTVGVVAASFPAARKLLDILAVDYATHGDLTISEAAELEGLDPNGLVEAVADVVHRSTPLWLDKSLRELMTMIETHHHALSRELLFRTRLRLNEAYKGSTLEDAQRLLSEFTSFAEELLEHIEYEELVVFPVVTSIEAASLSNARPVPQSADLADLRSAMQKLLRDHFKLTERARRLADLCCSIEGTQTRARANPEALRSVRAVEKHLRHYMALENHVLFPRALAIAEQLAAPREGATHINAPGKASESLSTNSASLGAQLR